MINATKYIKISESPSKEIETRKETTIIIPIIMTKILLVIPNATGLS
ncbi:hypothetical protein SPJ2_0474 [Streptococcus parauberis KRS-02109]|uniref:Uncharacterized protein n=1 Tax=Streptococcus parauberis KRS-02083 TaxID=1207545 RepID=A0ABN0IT52_9STRE|nr:hypothetical protein SPJ2_0474 [Streptococcus parauberis KRS-02109]EMG26066.1 hypothetical protein SPJ1_0028 [Streptococcus parauberis KRS-02083]